MQSQPLRTTVIGSYPFPGWLELASQQLDRFGSTEISEMQDDAVTVALADQLAAGLDVVTDGEQTRFDFNLSFYGYIEGIALESKPPRVFGPPAHDQRGRHAITGELKAPRGLGAVEEFERLKRIAASARVGPNEHVEELYDELKMKPPRDEQKKIRQGLRALGHRGGLRNEPASSVTLKASVPGPYTLAGRLIPNKKYKDRYAVTEALLPLVRDELVKLVAAGCKEITIDEPSMSCYAHKENTKRFVDIFNRTVEPIVGKTHLSTHLCFGNFKGRAVGPRKYAPMFPAFLDMKLDEIHVEMASREFSEIEIISQIAKKCDVAVGIIDVKSYYIETVEDVADRVKLCLKHAQADRLSFAPDCGLSQTARWAAKEKLKNMVEGVRRVRKEIGIE